MALKIYVIEKSRLKKIERPNITNKSYFWIAGLIKKRFGTFRNFISQKNIAAHSIEYSANPSLLAQYYQNRLWVMFRSVALQ